MHMYHANTDMVSVCFLFPFLGEDMKKAIIGGLFAGLVALSSACSFTVPHFANPGDITEATKEGRASCGIILGLFRTGDCSITTAARNADIHEVMVVDSVEANYIFYVKSETIVRGK